MNKEILITVVNYKSEREVYDFCKSVFELEKSDKIAIVVVDNCKSVNSTLKEDLENIEYIYYIDAKQNLGYFNGCLFGIEFFRKSFNFIPKWVIISNTDIFFERGTFFRDFLSKDYTKDTWVIGPSIKSSREIFDNPHRLLRADIKEINKKIRSLSVPQFFKRIYKAVFRKRVLSNAENTIAQRKIKKDSQFTYSVHGAFFFLRKEFFEELTEEKFGSFLYCEEEFVAEFALENEKKVFYDSELEVFHKENLTTGRNKASIICKYTKASFKYIKRRFYLKAQRERKK